MEWAASYSFWNRHLLWMWICLLCPQSFCQTYKLWIYRMPYLPSQHSSPPLLSTPTSQAQPQNMVPPAIHSQFPTFFKPLLKQLLLSEIFPGLLIKDALPSCALNPILCFLIVTHHPLAGLFHFITRTQALYVRNVCLFCSLLCPQCSQFEERENTG